MVLFTVDLLMSSHTPVASPSPSNGGDVMAVSGAAVVEQTVETDPLEVVVKKPMPLPIGVL